MTNMVAAGISFFGTEHSISDQIDANKHNAQVADFNADTVDQQGQASDQALERDIRATQGSMRASYGGSGVTMDGSPAEVMADSIRRGVLDRATNKYNYDTQARNYRNQADSYRLLAHNMKRTQFMTALAAGLASFNGGNGGMGNAGQTAQTNDSFSPTWSGGNSLDGSGTYTGSQSMSTDWPGSDGSMWNSNGSSGSTDFNGGWGS